MGRSVKAGPTHIDKDGTQTYCGILRERIVKSMRSNRGHISVISRQDAFYPGSFGFVLCPKCVAAVKHEPKFTVVGSYGGKARHSSSGQRFFTCPECEANFKLSTGERFPEHRFRGNRCPGSGTSVSVGGGKKRHGSEFPIPGMIDVRFDEFNAYTRWPARDLPEAVKIAKHEGVKATFELDGEVIGSWSPTSGSRVVAGHHHITGKRLGPGEGVLGGGGKKRHSGASSAAEKYVKSLKEPKKRAYAKAYLRSLLHGDGSYPERPEGKLSAMGATAIRENIYRLAADVDKLLK